MYIKRGDMWLFQGVQAVSQMRRAQLLRNIEIVSNEIDEYCNTRFEPTSDSYSLDFWGRFHTRKRPLLQVEELILNGQALVENIDFFIYPESSKIEIVRSDDNFDKKSLTVKYLYGYRDIPATVKQVAAQLIKLDAETKALALRGLQSENFDGEYSYTTQTSKDMTPAALRAGILAQLDIFKEKQYKEAEKAHLAKARLV